MFSGARSKYHVKMAANVSGRNILLSIAPSGISSAKFDFLDKRSAEIFYERNETGNGASGMIVVSIDCIVSVLMIAVNF